MIAKTMSRYYSFVTSCTVSAALTLLLGGCAATTQDAANLDIAAASASGNADDLLIVDCLLPGQVRKLGTSATYITARRPIKTTRSICEIRGGEYVAYDRADLRTALNIWLPSAQSGDPVAQAYVGEIYERGLGVPPDYNQAAQWYRKAAEQGNARAQINLGNLYEKGLGVSPDKAQALNWYRQASGLTGDQLAFTSSVQELRNQIAASNRETASARQEADQLRAQLNQLQSQLNNQQSALSNSRRELEQNRQQLLQERQRQRSAPAAPTAPAPQNDQRIRNLEQQVEQKEAQIVQLRREQGRIEQEASLLQVRLNEGGGDSSALQNQIAGLQQQLDASQSQLQQRSREQEQQLQAERTQLQQERREVEQIRAELQQQSSVPAGDGSPEVQRLATQVQQQEQELISKEQRIRELESQQTTSQNTPEMASLRGSLEQTERELEQTRRLLRSQGSQSSRNSADIQRLTSQLQTQEQELESKERQIENLQGVLNQTRQDNASRELQAQRESLDEAKQQLEQARTALAQHSESVNTQTSVERQQLQTELERREELLQQREVKNQELEQELGQVQEELEETRGREAALVQAQAETQAETRTRGIDAGNTSAPAKPNFPNLDFGNYYALIIGNNTYADFPNLETAVNDAEDVAGLLRSRYGFQTTILKNASRYQILSALNSLREKLTEQDNFLLYYAGHGTLDQANTRGNWLPVDAEQASTANWISNTSITDVINAMTAKHVMVIADSCYSGTLTRAVTTSIEGGRTPEQQEKWLTLMLKTRSRTVLSSGGLKPVLDSGDGRNSVFAKNLLRVLRSNDEILEGPLLFRAVSRQVKSDAAKLGVDQNPLYSPIKFAGDLGAPFFFKPVN